MSREEQLMNQIEKERKLLNGLLEKKETAEVVYRQSLVVDALIEKYMDLK